MITYHEDLIQGSDEWIAARCGILGASSMKLIMTPTLKPAKNDKTRAHVYEIAAQRVTRYVEPTYIGDDMLRGMDDEIIARELYHEKVAPVRTTGLITNDRWGFTLGYSPDGLVGDDGLIEIKSRRQRFQIELLAVNVAEDTIPPDFMLQCQTGLLVSGRSWLDFISYSGGLHMAVIRVYPIAAVQAAIEQAAAEFEEDVQKVIARYQDAIRSKARLFETERRIVQEMYT
jgi:hypothetical protein